MQLNKQSVSAGGGWKLEAACSNMLTFVKTLAFSSSMSRDVPLIPFRKPGYEHVAFVPFLASGQPTITAQTGTCTRRQTALVFYRQLSLSWSSKCRSPLECRHQGHDKTLIDDDRPGPGDFLHLSCHHRTCITLLVGWVANRRLPPGQSRERDRPQSRHYVELELSDR